MPSDGDDSPPPRTLAERIARLGLEKEASGRPSLRASTFRPPHAGDAVASSEGPPFSRSYDGLSPPSTAAAALKPAVGPKPRIAAKPQLLLSPNVHAATLAQHVGNGGVDTAERAFSSSPTLGANYRRDQEPELGSVQERVQSLHRTQPALPANLNPFASPEMPTCFEQQQTGNAEDIAVPDRLQPTPMLRRSSSSVSRLPLPPLPPPLPSAPIGTTAFPPPLPSAQAGTTSFPPPLSTRHSSLGVAAGQQAAKPSRLPLPPPPPPPAALFHPPPTLPPKPS
ncbi:hypothetical protein IWW38_002346 [Coemansia aciculifera]|uniref:Uncharacterized protein n=1 Tax=Coemansia aciculifera TaxID=417176 RepID=A0ACC1M4A2_9FUNG|nr:hypothetical protein IWW38_002346 [Coemansia aciculifera]